MKVFTTFVIFCVFLALTCGFAVADEKPTVTYTKALKLAREDKPEEAIALLEKLIKSLEESGETSGSSLIDDALMQIGSIAQYKMGQYEKAQKAYEELVKRFPNSRNARRASKRLEQLQRDRVSGDEPLRIYETILHEFPRLGEKKALEMALDLYKRYPDFIRRSQLLIWIGDAYERASEFDTALKYYGEIVTSDPKSQWAYFATEKIGNTYLEKRQFDNAIDAYRKLAEFEPTHPGAALSAEQMIRLAKRFKIFRTIFTVSQIIVAAALLFWIIGTKWKKVGRKNLKGAAIDIALLSPMFIISIVWTLDNPLIYVKTFSLLWLTISIAAFCNHLYITTNEFSKRTKVVLAFGLSIVAVAAVYWACYQTDLLNLIFDSMTQQIKMWAAS